MRDLAFIAFLLALIGLGFRRPFLFVIGYAYVDIVAPQRLAYYMLNSVPLSLIFFVLAVGGWALTDDKTGARLSIRQGLMILLLAYCGYTTMTADFPAAALEKWAWVWKAMTFAIFLPFTLRTRLRIEALLLFMVLCASTIIIVGGAKTLVSGGGYGMLNLMVDNNAGLYEGSIISAVAIAIIPTILFLARHGTIYPPEWKVWTYAVALIFACLLIPIGTQARTGLVCLALFALLALRTAKHKLLWAGGMAAVVAIAIPLLPATYTERMNTIQSYQGDQSASTRVAVWKWTWGYVQKNPGGGGFNAYLQNKLTFDLTGQGAPKGSDAVTHDQARAYHSAYFEMLGEQGFFGLGLWLAIQALGILSMERLRRRFRRTTDPDETWIAPLATALQHGHLIYLAGALFVGIAFQPFVWMLIACEIGLDQVVRRREPAAAGFAPVPTPLPAAA